MLPVLKTAFKASRHYFQIILGSVLILSLSSCAFNNPGEKVCSVHDGDTFTTCAGNKIRLFGIDAPELRQRFGKESRDELASLVLERNVELDCNGKSYERLTCQVTLDGKNINAEMVKSGYAFDSPHYSHGLFQTQEKAAEAAGLGVWQVSNGGQRPWAYRHTAHGGQRKKRNHWVSKNIDY